MQLSNITGNPEQVDGNGHGREKGISSEDRNLLQ